MSNPFTYHAKPATPKEWQSNANHATYARMAAQDELNAWDADTNVKRGLLRIPADVIANVHTAKWVEKEAIRLAQKARASEASDRG